MSNRIIADDLEAAALVLKRLEALDADLLGTHSDVYATGKLEIHNGNGYRIGFAEWEGDYASWVFVPDYKED